MKPVFTTEHGALYRGDCLDLLATIPDGSIDLIFGDPPFNLGKDYGRQINKTRSVVPE